MKQKFGTDVREFGECVRRSSGAAFVAREIAAMAGASVEEKERIPSAARRTMIGTANAGTSMLSRLFLFDP